MTVGAGFTFLRVNDNNLVKIPIANLDFIKKPCEVKRNKDFKQEGLWVFFISLQCINLIEQCDEVSTSWFDFHRKK